MSNGSKKVVLQHLTYPKLKPGIFAAESESEKSFNVHNCCAGVKPVADESGEYELLLLLSTCGCQLSFSHEEFNCVCLNTCSFTSKTHVKKKKSFLMNRTSDSTHKTTGVVVSDRLGVTKSLQQRVRLEDDVFYMLTHKHTQAVLKPNKKR